MNLTKHNHTDFSIDELLKLKGRRKIFVVFSTFGEREADLVCEKITLLNTLPAGFIDRIILNHRRAGADSDRTETGVAALNCGVDIIVANELEVPDMGKEKGKGGDMRRSLYVINRDFVKELSPREVIVVFLDADVVPRYFGVHFVTALSGAVLKGADFAKAGFWRAMGRVKKFVAQPLFSVIEHPALKTLTEYSYPLAGECAGTLDFFNSMTFWQIYGVETGILVDTAFSGYSVADVNLGLYDHEHHSDMNIQKMCFGIMRTYLKSLMDHGVIELKHGAAVSDTFRCEYIDEKGERIAVNENLTELKYPPLKDIL
jgi:glucosyl-3-phosphoglycerate synthase